MGAVATPEFSLIGGGTGRNASVWLTTALRSNSALPNAMVAHESFRLHPWVTFMEWKQTDSPVVIETNVSLEILLTLIEAFGAQVGVVLREPVAWIQSLVSRMLRNKKPKTPDISKFTAGQWLDTIRHVTIASFCRTETMLAIMEHTGLPQTCWHMDYCTTEKGLREIAAWAALPLRKKFQLPAKSNSTKAHGLVNIRAKCSTAEKEIHNVIRQFKRVRAAYDSVGVHID